MVLASFFILSDVEGSSKRIAAELPKEESHEPGNEYAVPSDQLARYVPQLHSVREKDGRTEVKMGSRWYEMDVWNGKPVTIDTYD